MSRYDPTEHVGVAAVQAIVAGDLKWIFRPQPIADMGIDAQLELVEDGTPTGKLIGVQIKTGKGNYNDTKEAYVYYGKDAHLDYWLNLVREDVLEAHSVRIQHVPTLVLELGVDFDA